MADKITLAADPRTIIGKQNKQLRRAGITPIVVYGRHSEPVSLQVQTRDLLKVLSQAGGTQVVHIDVAGEKRPRMALAKSIQRHVTRLTPIHADFVEVQMDKMVSVSIPVVVDGEPDLVKSGEAMLGILQDRVQVEALPGNLPDAFVIDVSSLADMHSAVRAGDLVLPANVRLLDDPDLLLVHLSSTAAATAATAAMDAAAEAAAEGPATEPEDKDED